MKLILKKEKSKGNKLKFCNVNPVVNSSAFTIVELLLAITIIGLLFGGGIGGYLGLQKRTAIDQSAMNLKKDIEYMKHSALLNRKDSADAKWISGFAVKIYKNNNNQLVYHKYKFCSGSNSFESFNDAGIITNNSFIDGLTVCGESESKRFVSFEKKEDILFDPRVKFLSSQIATNDIRLIVFETITGNVHFYKYNAGTGTYAKINGDLAIKLCSQDNKAGREIDVKRDSRIQFVYGGGITCSTVRN